MPRTRGRVPSRRVGGSAAPSAFVAGLGLAVLLGGCGASGPPGDAPPTRLPSRSAEDWTPAQAQRELARAERGFAEDLDDFYRQRRERHPVASYAVQCEVLLPELTRFVGFLREGRWPATARPRVTELVEAQTAYDAGVRRCAQALTDRALRAGFAELDRAPVRSRLTRLEAALR